MVSFDKWLKRRAVTKDIGIVTFKKDQATGEEQTPHWLMERALDMYENLPLMKSGIDQIVLFIVGNNIRIESEDDKTIEWVNDWLKYRRQHMIEVIQNVATKYLVAGNAYVEFSFLDDEFEKLDNLFDVPDPSRIYYNVDSKTNQDYWIVRVADSATNELMINGKVYAVTEWKPYRYSTMSLYWNKFIRGYKEWKQKFRHIRVPYTIDGKYGYSFIMSALRAGETIDKIMRNVILIASQKAIGRKIIGMYDDNGRMLSEEAIEELQMKLNSEYFDDLIVDKKLDVVDLSPSQYDTMMNEVDFARREIFSGLLPTYMTPWNSDVNRASAEQARVPFIAFIEKHRQKLQGFFTEILNEYLKKLNPKLNDFEVVFDGTDFYSIEEKKDMYMDLYLNNIITYNELRTKLGLEPLDGGDKFYQQIMNAMDGEVRYSVSYKDEGNTFKDSFMNERVTTNKLLQEKVIAKYSTKGHDIRIETDGKFYYGYDADKLIVKSQDKKEVMDEVKHYRDNLGNIAYADYLYDDNEKEVLEPAKKELESLNDEVLNLINKHVKNG